MNTVKFCLKIVCIIIFVGILSPASFAAIPEPAAWYDAGTLAGMTTGMLVNAWKDLSSNDLDLSTLNQGVDISISYTASVATLNDRPAVNWPGGGSVVFGPP